MKAVIDTNVLIFDYVENSEFHKRAEEILDSLDEWIIPTIVIHEFIWFLKKNNLDSHVTDVLAYINNEKSKVVCDSADIITTAINILINEKTTLSHYNDLVILSHSLKNNLPLATFDRKLSNIAKKHGVEVLN